ncbi:LSD1-like 1 [Actinidia rufa]|uniref:LSD1-like 1 n=1 Tax=Actinidia rufa TaxID=165716 RepID=A0A7J0H5C6_9ERIC|nr:LSD1-like 1 [Actinidia rufa]
MIRSAAAFAGLRVHRARKSTHGAVEIDDAPSKNRCPRRPSDLSKEDDTEALTPISVGFPVDSLTEEEIEANVVSQIGGAKRANYIVVCNHILARWRSNVSIWLSRDHALDSIRLEHRSLVSSAYAFLLEHGYINFGLSPSISEAKSRPPVMTLHEKQCMFKNVCMVILGSFSGGTLMKPDSPQTDGGREIRPSVGLGGRAVGHHVPTIRIGRVAGVTAGGRCKGQCHHNRRRDRRIGGCQAVLRLWSWKTEHGLAANTDEEDDRKKGGWGSGGGRRGRRGRAHRNQWQSTWELLQGNWSFHSIRGSQERMLLNWHLANLEYANATLMLNLSMAFWDQDDPYEMGGDHYFIPGGNERYFIPGGNERFIRALAEDLPIFYDRRVESIRYEVDGVLVYANGQGYRGDMVLCTVSLGVLKKGSIEFVPELPQRKKDLDLGGPLLVAGEAAIKFEKMSPVEAVERVLEILRGIFNPEWVAVPNPIQAVCTCSGQDQFTYGSYSYVAIGASGDDYGILSESIGDGRVFFAGEATNKQYPATMHGAFLSGMREAANILRGC